MFENKISSKGIHYSRYIASWARMGGRYFEADGRFGRWLKAEGLTEEEITDICILAKTGKMELENSCLKYID